MLFRAGAEIPLTAPDEMKNPTEKPYIRRVLMAGGFRRYEQAHIARITLILAPTRASALRSAPPSPWLHAAAAECDLLNTRHRGRPPPPAPKHCARICARSTDPPCVALATYARRAPHRGHLNADFWQQCRRTCADAFGQAGPIVGAALGHRWGRERLFVECCESGRRQAAVQHASAAGRFAAAQIPSVASRARSSRASRSSRVAGLDRGRELYGYRCCEGCPRRQGPQRFALVTKGARYARALCISPRHKCTYYSREIAVERPALDAGVLDGIEETGINAFTVAVADVFRVDVFKSRSSFLGVLQRPVLP